MAANAPTMEEHLALVQTLQGQVAALTAAAAAASAPIAAPAPVATPAPVAFADTPNVLEVDDLIDYSTKKGLSNLQERDPSP